MARQLVGPGEEQVHLVAHAAGERPAGRALVCLELVAIAVGLGRRQHGHGEMESITAVLRHRLGTETLAHGHQSRRRTRAMSLDDFAARCGCEIHHQ